MTTPTVPHLYHEPVRWGDVDPVAITRFDAYTRFLEIGEDELFRHAGRSMVELQERHDLWFPRKIMHVEYFAPSKLGEMLTIASYLSRVGTTGCTVNVDVFNEDGTLLHAAMHLVIVCVTKAGFEKMPIPDEVRDLLVRLECSVEAARAVVPSGAKGLMARRQADPSLRSG